MFKKHTKKISDTDSMENGVQVIVEENSNDVNTERFNTIRTNIQYSSVDKEYRSLLFTSSVVSEGKSTVATNIASSYAKSGKKVLLVDADLRRPTLKRTFNVSSMTGLTRYLSDKTININEIIFQTTLKNLYIMPSGPLPPNPSELLGSRKMEKTIQVLAENFDLVIYDTPPVLYVPDAQILTGQVDGIVLIARENYTDKFSIKKSIESLKNVKGNIIGAILNDVKDTGNGYNGYYR